MHDRDFYARILGLVDPWQVRDVRLEVQGGEVRVEVGTKATAALECPECGKADMAHDQHT